MNLRRSVRLATALLLLPLSLEAASFGPGRAALIGGGGGEVLLDSTAKEVSVRFVAEHDRALTSIRFASRVGQGWDTAAPDIFAAALLADDGGKPGRKIAAATVPATAPGARAREAVFKNVTLKAGAAYHFVVSLPAKGGDANQVSLNYYLVPSGGLALDSFDMETPATGAAVLASDDGGKSWTPVAQGALGAVAITIGGHLQGWGYTNSFDIRLWHSTDGGEQALMQSFRFTTGGKGRTGKVDAVTFKLRAQGGLAGVKVPLRIRILDASGKEVGASSLASVDAADAGSFFTVSAPFKNTVLNDGGEYVLSLDIPDAAGATPADFLFIRAFIWGFGNPSLTDVGWQGEAHSLIQSPTADPVAGQPVPKIDLPFVLDYTPVR